MFSEWLNEKEPGQLFSIMELRAAFPHLNLRKVIRQALREKKLLRWAPRVYGIPKKMSTLFLGYAGYAPPGVARISDCYAQSKKWIYTRHPAYWINLLGVSTQVPVRDVYVKVGRSHQLHIYRNSERGGSFIVDFDEEPIAHALALAHRPVGPVLISLYYLGPEESNRWIHKMLRPYPWEEVRWLQDELPHMPGWMKKVVRKGIRRFPR